MKRIIVVLLAVVLAFSCVGGTAFADNIIIIRSEEYAANGYLYVDGNDIHMTSSCNTYSEIEKLVIETTLEKFWGLFIWTKYSGPTNRTYYTDGKLKTCVWNNAVIGAENGTYRMKCVFTLTKMNGQTVTITKYSNEVQVPN